MEVAIRPPELREGTQTDKVRSLGRSAFEPSYGVSITDHTKQGLAQDAWTQFAQEAKSFCGESSGLDPANPVLDERTIARWQQQAGRLVAATTALAAIVSDGSGVSHSGS